MLKRKERTTRRKVSEAVKTFRVLSSCTSSVNYSEDVPVNNIVHCGFPEISLVSNDQNNSPSRDNCSVDSRYESSQNPFFDSCETSSRNNSSKIKNESLNFPNSLREWAINYQINQNALTSLLRILSDLDIPRLPTDARSFLKTPRTTLTRWVEPGQYCHIGVWKWIKQVIESHPKDFKNNQEVLLDISIDGLPISRSSNSQFWPIQGCVLNVPNSTPFIIGIYHGYQKPKCANTFLQDFISEMCDIREGVEHNNKFYQIKLGKFVCDTPARSFITCIKGHNAYYGCGKCQQKGTYYRGRVTFNPQAKTLRTDNSFKNQDQKSHHNGESNLLAIGVGMVSQFPDDPMHLLYLGLNLHPGKEMLRLKRYHQVGWIQPTHQYLGHQELNLLIIFRGLYLQQRSLRRAGSSLLLPTNILEARQQTRKLEKFSDISISAETGVGKRRKVPRGVPKVLKKRKTPDSAGASSPDPVSPQNVMFNKADKLLGSRHLFRNDPSDQRLFSDNSATGQSAHCSKQMSEPSNLSLPTDILQTILKSVEIIKLRQQQHGELLDLLHRQVNQIQKNARAVEASICSFSLPVKTMEHMLKLNQELSILTAIGGTNVGDATRKVLSRLMSNNVASNFNWEGRGNKTRFRDFNICDIAIEAVFEFFDRKSSLTSIENAVKAWLKLSPFRKNGGTNSTTSVSRIDDEDNEHECELD
ncbi:unnamed protein product [Allacma fusca]|uniref:DUF4806 domain-containing protein n=1 Tax=Allacma fusca TaxID=39272 RepID=A0A8J2KJI7_9HEXA|nr:unnamed protein product [Allacma fusca]